MCTDELKRFSCFQIMTGLKVIGVGLGHTGTKSLQQALVLFLTKVYGADPREQETDVRKLYLDWNEELKRSIKKENLLVFNVKEGWGPLCKFLGVPEPKQPFPNLNSREFFQKKYVEGLLAKKD